jgi:mono/diheme cytochrome c family protein
MRPAHLLLACLLALPARLPAAEPVDYLRDIKPVLRDRCYACHGALKQKAKLRLDTAAFLLTGGSDGPVIEPGRPEKSLLIERVAAADESTRMPPVGKPLTDRQIAALKAWIRQGAPAPADEPPQQDPRRHWAYQRPVRPSVPAVRDAAWVRNPIDAFVAAERAKHGLAPVGPADRATLLRRVYLDLTGLPPTRAELHAFLADPAPDAYERVVDRLLASPRYAERWARHWMDVWRYSDWYGSRYINELRNSRRHIWRWRDWIIESLERDKGYDRMVLEMLAGDELAPGDWDVQRAGGYLGRSFYVFNRNVWLQDTAEYTAAAFLGVTLKCCRCHDHKYDPIPQEEYYRFRAVFEPYQVRTDPIPGRHERLKANIAMGSPPGSELKDGLDCVYDADLAAPTYLFERGNDKYPVKDHVIRPGVPVVLHGELRVEPVTLPVEAFYPALRPAVREEMLREARAAVEKAEAERETARDALAIHLAERRLAAAQVRLAALEARIAAEVAKYTRPAGPEVERLARRAGQAERTANLRQVEAELAHVERQLAIQQNAAGTLKKQRQVLDAKLAEARKAAAALATTYTPLGPVYPSTSSGRRLALARWMVRRDNPLTARVAVNHIWLRHLGSALVPTVSNFGLNGKRPTHPKLLDWLAVEFMEHGWSMKYLHRLIVTSNTYRLASEEAEPQAARDASNRYLWRANVRRMEAEVVRDSLLYLAGRLDERRGGEDLDPTTDAVVPRRSLYFRHTPDEKPLILEVFDAANPSECFERTESIIPQQALALANSDFCRAQARAVAQALPDADFVTAAFEQVLARPPLADERARCTEFLRRYPRARGRENLVHVLFNYNEFVTIR